MTGNAAPGDDARFMRLALRLAARARRTHPNPRVGAVPVKGDRIIGKGYHRGVGTPRAETAAFANAGGPETTRGATLYVTLEPCSFTGGGRTPCSKRCLDAGVARVVAAMTDPDARVSGQGFAQLRAAGIDVAVGVEEKEARDLNRFFVKHRTTGLPYVTHKTAMTLDGKIAAPGGHSKWVTGEKARGFAHRHLRSRVDALVVGVGTLLADDPELTTRGGASGNGQDPLRVIMDSHLRTPPDARAVRVSATSAAGTVVVGAASNSKDVVARRQALEAAGAEVVLLAPDERGRVDVRAVAGWLAERGALDVLLEGGGELAASFWQTDLVDEYWCFLAPKIIGGRNAQTPVEGDGLGAAMTDARLLNNLTIRRLGNDVALTGKVNKT